MKSLTMDVPCSTSGNLKIQLRSALDRQSPEIPALH
jgi:hypothetical protein